MTVSAEGAILRRDGRTCAVTTRIPAGIITPDQRETIAGTGLDGMTIEGDERRCRNITDTCQPFIFSGCCSLVTEVLGTGS